MAYFAPYIDESGLHIPTYSDIRDAIVSDAKTIFGQDIYLEADSQDYQFISSLSAYLYDTMQSLQIGYISRSPATSIGTGLDGIVKINGIKRKAATYSTCPVVISGTTGTVITNGVIEDINKIKWNLPTTVTIGIGGTVTVQATCQQPGSISAGIGEINSIVTPTYGWLSVTNTVAVSAANIGTNVETDAELRARQTVSTAQASRTVLEGTKGEIAAVIGVTRSLVYENDANAVDANNLPAHSITAVVEGGTDEDVAKAIFNKKGPGCYTNGSTSVTVTDQYTHSTVIRFYRPLYVDIDVTVNVKQLAGYTTQMTANIKTAIANYLNSLSIGDDLSTSSLWGAALAAMSDLTKPAFSITGLTAAKHGDTQGTSDIVIAFNEVTRGSVANITVNVT